MTPLASSLEKGANPGLLGTMPTVLCALDQHCPKQRVRTGGLE